MNMRELSLNKYSSIPVSFFYSTRVENNYYDCVIVESRFHPVGLKIAMIEPHWPNFFVSEDCEGPITKDKYTKVDLSWI
jgi:hypothetical protein